MSDRFIKMFATWFYIGDIPGAPGTIASAAGAFIAIILSPGLYLYILFFIVVIVVGFYVCGRMEKILDRSDPSCIVIDEVAGIMVAFFLLPLTPAVVITAFFLFRAFDMFKIYPVNKFEQFKGSVGVMTDDLVAGLYTNIVMQFAIRWAGIV